MSKIKILLVLSVLVLPQVLLAGDATNFALSAKNFNRPGFYLVKSQLVFTDSADFRMSPVGCPDPRRVSERHHR